MGKTATFPKTQQVPRVCVGWPCVCVAFCIESSEVLEVYRHVVVYTGDGALSRSLSSSCLLRVT